MSYPVAKNNGPIVRASTGASGSDTAYTKWNNAKTGLTRVKSRKLSTRGIPESPFRSALFIESDECNLFVCFSSMRTSAYSHINESPSNKEPSIEQPHLFSDPALQMMRTPQLCHTLND